MQNNISSLYTNNKDLAFHFIINLNIHRVREQIFFLKQSET